MDKLNRRLRMRSGACNGTARIARGFTTIELLVTFVIVAGLAAAAMPSFVKMVRDTKLTTAAEMMQADLLIARREAIKRNVRIPVCPHRRCDQRQVLDQLWRVAARLERLLRRKSRRDSRRQVRQHQRRPAQSDHPALQARRRGQGHRAGSRRFASIRTALPPPRRTSPSPATGPEPTRTGQKSPPAGTSCSAR